MVRVVGKEGAGGGKGIINGLEPRQGWLKR